MTTTTKPVTSDERIKSLYRRRLGIKRGLISNLIITIIEIVAIVLVHPDIVKDIPLLGDTALSLNKTIGEFLIGTANDANGFQSVLNSIYVFLTDDSFLSVLFNYLILILLIIAPLKGVINLFKFISISFKILKLKTKVKKAGDDVIVLNKEKNDNGVIPFSTKKLTSARERHKTNRISAKIKEIAEFKDDPRGYIRVKRVGPMRAGIGSYNSNDEVYTFDNLDKHTINHTVDGKQLKITLKYSNNKVYAKSEDKQYEIKKGKTYNIFRNNYGNEDKNYDIKQLVISWIGG